MSRDANYWDDIAGKWQDAPRQELWRAHSDAVNNALLSRWLPDKVEGYVLKTDLFDEAVSIGLRQVLSRHITLVGIDISVRIVQAANLRWFGLKGVGSDVRRMAFAGDTFTGVISNSTLDHFDTRKEIVSSVGEIHRILKPGGFLIITLDNLANPLIILRNWLPYRLLHCLGIVPYKIGATMGPGMLCQVLEQVGFDVLDVDAVMHCPRILAVALADMMEGVENHKRFFKALMMLERLSILPTRFLTGHMVAILAIKRGES